MTGDRVVLALGSNLGDRETTLASAVRDLADLPGATLVAVSPSYESAAVKLDGVDERAPRYLNAVLTIDYTGDAYALLDAVNAIEAEHGRVRAERWGDRTLDIDIIAFGQLSIDDARLTVPHPRAAERDFVLAPWLDLDEQATVPGRGLVRDLLAATGQTVRRATDVATLHPAPGTPR
ncbi:2-amino-4-hydroxy-6-hydroxymethyldihydropteridine diphosphokinase [Cryobacterium sp. TMS1-20-1]|uniref:2-amino-4-hydroxy-6- hydroxymethyldihydropteridine diphosphokinase n=1 Tax=unclassified Cryobacterium TaxID=2649013 RepID=UPI00106C907B|nr:MULTISPECIES: 2-amino-4-hydroxy-6-hydroxymethyldihydropteridine diphosphokinase [unclassified Cryobacterium]TFC73066.1 2-amino-4-hydroxy-6-hydroxymethyldihydropteridine diphosphokinase [Cryobacterium sp. TMS1-20-1]TFD49729.1 2-amino-4-hydroxy-6-hydroxymethyldihydropteridine diphosphokinase [Cryobacterium sp. Hh11]